MARRITFPMIRFKQNLNVLIHSRIRILGYVNFVIREDTNRERERERRGWILIKAHERNGADRARRNNILF